MNTGTSTASSTKALLAMLMASGPATVSAFPADAPQAEYALPWAIAPSVSPLLKFSPQNSPTNISSQWASPTNGQLVADEVSRETTAQERLIGEIRRYALKEANWDAEGALPPLLSSLKEAADFVRLFNTTAQLPEPMLFGTGHAGLFWHTDDLYADLKFLGDGRVAYFIEHRDEGKHKGISNFDSQRMPAVFQALL